jgi:MerR family copper efflux transcriptional regulator
VAVVDPECGFLHHQHDPRPVPIELSPPRPATEDDTEPVPIACALDGAGQEDRIRHWHQVLGQAQRREPVDGGLRVHLAAHLAGEVAELATAEQRCCAFFTFTPTWPSTPAPPTVCPSCYTPKPPVLNRPFCRISLLP